MAEGTNGNGRDEAEVKTPFFSASLKGKDIQLRDVIALCTLIGAVFLGTLIWQHREDTKENTAALISAVKELTVSTRQQTRVQREMNCLIALPTEKREGEYKNPYGICKLSGGL